MLDPIPGNPAALAESASLFGAGGGALDIVIGCMSMTSEAELAGWRGTADRAFRDHLATTRQGLRQGAEACREIGTVLHRLSTQLADAQEMLRRANSMLAAGDQADAIFVGAEAEELARQAFTAAGGAFARIEATARTPRAAMAVSQPAPSTLVTPIGQRLAPKAVLPVVPVGPSIQVTPVLGGLWREFVPIAPPTNQPLTSGSASDPRDILMPGGNPIGTAGSSKRVRELPGGISAAEALFRRLASGGTPHAPPGYPGKGFDLPGGGWVGLRRATKSPNSPAIDISIPGIGLRKIHF